jgi:type IV pilus assembly protein PilF
MRLVLVLLAVLGLAACKTTTTTAVDGTVVSQTTGKPAQERDRADRARIRLELASAYFSNGQMAPALEEARRALAIDPSYAPAYGFLGVVYMDLNERAQAEENFRRALQLDPANPEINNNFGWFLCRTGRERESVPYFDRALRDPLYATPARAAQNAGLCLARVQDYAAAEPYLRRAFELEPGNASIQYELARVSLSRGQLERATFYYQLLTREGGEAASAPVLWLGVRLARAGGDLRTETRRARLLSEKFPGSPEAARLQKGQFDE